MIVSHVSSISCGAFSRALAGAAHLTSAVAWASLSAIVLVNYGLYCLIIPNTDPDGPVQPVQFRETADLGVLIVDDADKLQHTFRIHNNDRREVRLERPKPPCGCAALELRKAVLGPGEETTLEVAINNKGVTGRRTLDVSIVNDAGDPWRYRLTYTAFQRARFLERSGYLGVLAPGHAGRQTVTLQTSGRDQADLPRIEEVAVKSHQIHAAVSAARDATEDARAITRTHDIEIVFNNASRPGTFSDLLTARIYEPASRRTVIRTLPLYWTVRARYESSPARLYFTSRPPGPVSRALVVSAAANVSAFRVSGAKSTHPAVKCAVESQGCEERKAWIVKATLDPTFRKQSVHGEILIELDDPAQPLVIVPFGAIQAEDLRTTSPGAT